MRTALDTNVLSGLLLADFAIGYHALGSADRLMTFDQNFYRQYFPHLRLL